jgi:hypothetical protein
MSGDGPAKVAAQTLIDEPVAPIVVVDFARFSTDSTLADLLHREVRGHGLHRIDAMKAVVASPAAKEVSDLALAYADSLLHTGVVPEIVVGHCNASRFSLHLASALGQRGHRPTVVVVEPIWPTLDTIAADLRSVRESLGAVGDLPDRLTLSEVLAVVEQDLLRKLRADGVPEDELEQCTRMLLARYRGWFGFLLANSRTSDPVPAFPYRMIVANDSEAAPVAAAGASVHRLPIEAKDVLHSHATVAAILAAVGR